MSFSVLNKIEPPWTILGKKIEKKIRKAILENSLLEEDKIAIALSGGKDSLTLLYMLNAISGKGVIPFKIFAIHVCGKNSCGASISSSFLPAICDSLNIPLSILPFPDHLTNLNCYSCSRIRRKLIFEEAKRLGISTVAFGHHRDDAIQTLLLNLFQKAEFASLLPKVPMYYYKVKVIRPMIYLSENEIIAFAKLNKYYRVTCFCEKGATSRRKEVEQKLLELENLFPHVRKNLFLAATTYGTKKALLIPKNLIKEEF